MSLAAGALLYLQFMADARRLAADDSQLLVTALALLVAAHRDLSLGMRQTEKMLRIMDADCLLV